MQVFIPPQKKSAQVNFLWGKNDVRTAIQQFYTPNNFYAPKNKFLATPLAAAMEMRVANGRLKRLKETQLLSRSANSVCSQTFICFLWQWARALRRRAKHVWNGRIHTHQQTGHYPTCKSTRCCSGEPALAGMVAEQAYFRDITSTHDKHVFMKKKLWGI